MKDFNLGALLSHAERRNLGEKPKRFQIIFLLTQIQKDLDPHAPSNATMAVKESHREPCQCLKSEDGNK